MDITLNLDRQVTLQRQSVSRNPDGTQSTAWVTFATPWAGRRDVAGSRRGELFASSVQHTDTLFTEWTIRYIDGLDGSERMIDDRGAVLNVVGIPAEVGRREYLVITTERGVVK
jgi:head-tail adaptor